MFSATRSSEIIDILHAHGLCLFYERRLLKTQGLGEALSQLSHDDDAVIPGLLRTALFTVGAKDNIDKNARCTRSLGLSIMEQVCHCSNFYRALMTGLKGTTSDLLKLLPLEAKR